MLCIHLLSYGNMVVRKFEYDMNRPILRMGFNRIKKKAIKCLEDGAYIHEARQDIDVKNLLKRVKNGISNFILPNPM